MTHDKEKARETFLIEWYKILWNNAHQSMASVWRMLGPITLVGTIWFAMFKKYLPFNLGNALIFIILYWAINITIDFHQWYRRNLIFFTSVEREFFNDRDYGKLIPAKFKCPQTNWTSFFRISLVVFCTMLCIALYVSILPFIDPTNWNYVWYERFEYIVFFAGSIFSIINYCDQEKSSEDYIKELFGNRSNT